MRKESKPSPTESPLLFEVDPQPIEETLTALEGIPLLVQAFRSLGLPQSVKDHVRVKERERGHDEATFVESFVLLNAGGGECPEDFKRLRADPGLAEMIGHELPSPAAALQFLYAFHAEEKIAEAQQRRLPEQIAYIPEETQALEGLGRVNRDLVQCCGERCPDQRMATVDQDATIIESHKQEALPTYEGKQGYQPMLAVWAETGLVLADHFRDGNVPAQMEPLAVAQRAFAALPSTVREYYYRGDSACHESHLVNWLRDEQREGGIRIGGAVAHSPLPHHRTYGARIRRFRDLSPQGAGGSIHVSPRRLRRSQFPFGLHPIRPWVAPPKRMGWRMAILEKRALLLTITVRAFVPINRDYYALC